MPSPPTKRQRTEDASITRSKVWYKDGSVVLQAESTQFRVHWGVLSGNSTFFRGLEDLPQPSDQPTVDGCPIVELPDAVIDVEYLLKALYDPTFLAQTELPLKAVGALFKNLLDSAVARVMFEYPMTLQDFDKWNALSTSRILDCPGIIPDLVTLARENDIVSALPVGYYQVARCDIVSSFVCDMI
ncbi:hypothetical protein B0H14DRAFT_2989372 [Mycena olivaceomarginata]|nr:hypothetical protein B0H14DRAFT_2989372 [Mycena olivaceomarginata]